MPTREEKRTEFRVVAPEPAPLQSWAVRFWLSSDLLDAGIETGSPLAAVANSLQAGPQEQAVAGL